MQKINIKKLTKEQMLAMLEAAVSEKEDAEKAREEVLASLSAKETALSQQSAAMNELTVKLEENEKALEEAEGNRDAYRTTCDDLRAQLRETEEKLQDSRQDMVAMNAAAQRLAAMDILSENLHKAEKGKRELAKQLGERTVELDKFKDELKAAEGRASRKDELLDEALHRLEVEKAIAEGYHESLKWCMAHPWRNVWRCMKDYFRF